MPKKKATPAKAKNSKSAETAGKKMAASPKSTSKKPVTAKDKTLVKFDPLMQPIPWSLPI
ncbi:MAG: hypothetical protein P8010_07460 [Desulfosarcinaceae bacterium]